MDYLYSIYRAVALILNLIALLITTLEIICLRWKKSKTRERKHFIHYCCAFSFIILIFASMDPEGVFSITNFFAFKYCLLFSGTWIEYGFCLIIYCHFHAHYLTLRKPLPKFIGRAFALSVFLKDLTNGIGLALVMVYHNIFYLFVGYLAGALWLTTCVIVDLTGYYLVRKAIKDIESGQIDLSRSKTQDRPNSPSSPSKTVLTSANTPPASASDSVGTHHANYNEVLARMQRFHVTTIALCIIFFAINIQSIFTCLTSYGIPPTYPNPNEFGVPDSDFLMPLAYPILWACLTWWAWIPLSLLLKDGKELESDGKSVTATQQSKSENPPLHRSRKEKSKEDTAVSLEVPPIIIEEERRLSLQEEEIESPREKVEEDEPKREHRLASTEMEWKGVLLLQKLQEEG